VHLATYGGLLAARSINSVLAGEVDEERAFGEFEGRYRREYRVFYEFLSAFYDMQSTEESYFWKARKVTNFNATDMEAFVSLVGGVHSGEQALVGADDMVTGFQKSSGALADAVERTGTMQTASGERMHHLFGTPVVREVMTEMNNIQVRGVQGDVAKEAPLLDDGLVPSPDGLAWAEPAGKLQEAR
jgi:halogenation protein CepH